jgi:peptide/nickel transport system substrate-binding protein
VVQRVCGRSTATSTWTNWPTETTENQTLPTTWSGYWQMGGVQTLINLTLTSPE